MKSAVGNRSGRRWTRVLSTLLGRRALQPTTRMLAAASIAIAALAGASSLAGIQSVSASVPTGSLFVLTEGQTIASGGTSGSVIVQAQSNASTPEPIFQTSPLTVDIVTSLTEGSTVTGISAPSSVTIPAGAFSVTFTFSASNSSTTENGTFDITVSATNYDATAQTETVSPIPTSATTTVAPGHNNGGTSGPVAVAPNSAATYFDSSATGAGITNSSGVTLYYGVESVGGTVVPGGGGSVSGLSGCTEAATDTTVVPPVVTIETSPDRPQGDYSLDFLVEAFTDSTCTAGYGFYDADVPLDITNGAYTPLSSPTRVLDTRKPGQGPKLGANSVRTVSFASFVPASATSVTLNVTVTDTTAASFLTAYPSGTSQPAPSNLNWPAGDTVANLVIVQLGSGSGVNFYNSQGQTDLVVDLEGYFAPESVGGTAGSYVPLAPDRICDTRPTSVSGITDQCSGKTLGAGTTLPVTVAGEGGVPSSGITAVVANVTVTDTTRASFLTVFPGGTSMPLASNLNWSAGQTIPNRVMIPVTGSGVIDVYNDAGNADVIVDVDGYITSGSSSPSNETLFIPITPVRVLDTRETGGTFGPGGTLIQRLAGISQLDPFGGGATAVAMNVTATNTTAASFLTVYPGGALPNVSDLNWSAGWTVPNLCVATLSSGGAVELYNDQGRTDVILDVFGFFTPTDSST